MKVSHIFVSQEIIRIAEVLVVVANAIKIVKLFEYMAAHIVFDF